MEGDEIISLFFYAQIDARLQIGGVVLRPADVVIRPGVDDPVTEILQQRTGLQRDLQRDIFFVDALIPARRSAVISAMSGIDEDRRLFFLLRGDEGINTVCFLRARRAVLRVRQKYADQQDAEHACQQRHVIDLVVDVHKNHLMYHKQKKSQEGHKNV